MKFFGKGEQTARRKDAVLTRTEKQKSRSQVEEFIRTDRIWSYPEIDADLKEEAALVYTGPDLLSVLTALVESAIARGSRAPVLLPRTIAGMLLASYDELSGCDVERLPPSALTTARLLAHVVSLPVRLDPRVAVAVARRAVQVLLNRGSVAPPAMEAGAEPDESLSGETDSGESAPDEELCVECGASCAAGTSHRCGGPGAAVDTAAEAARVDVQPTAQGPSTAAQPSGAPEAPVVEEPSCYFPTGELIQVDGSELEKLADWTPPPFELLEPRGRYLVPPRVWDELNAQYGPQPEPLATLEQVVPTKAPDSSVSDPALHYPFDVPFGAGSPDSYEAPPVEPAPPLVEEEPPPAPKHGRVARSALAEKTHRILLLDYTKKRVTSVAEPAQPLPRDHVERTVIAYARMKENLRFFFEESIGKDGHFDCLSAGTIVEVLEPNERDQRDQDQQKRRDVTEKRPPRQLVVIWWRGAVSLVWGSEVERATEDEYKKYIEEARDDEAGRQAGSEGARSVGDAGCAPRPAGQ